MAPKKKGGAKKGSKKKAKGKADKGDKWGDERQRLKSMLDEWFYMGPYHERNVEQKLKAKIDAAFKLFERHQDGPSPEQDQAANRCCDVREVPTIVRSLGLNPTKEQLQMMLDEIEEPEPTGYIRYSRLEALMLEVLKTSEYIPKGKKFDSAESSGDMLPPMTTLLVRADENTILRAFRKLDTNSERPGEIPIEDPDDEKKTNNFARRLMTQGRSKDEQFNKEEVMDMIQAAADPDTGVIKYEESGYIDQLVYE
eukprot:Hpha_TRINITY_DN30121_c0_g1::TRINITY_DN30121_c0_g1_i1::g.110641::m.110641